MGLFFDSTVYQTSYQFVENCRSLYASSYDQLDINELGCHLYINTTRDWCSYLFGKTTKIDSKMFYYQMSTTLLMLRKLKETRCQIERGDAFYDYRERDGKIYKYITSGPISVPFEMITESGLYLDGEKVAYIDIARRVQEASIFKKCYYQNEIHYSVKGLIGGY